MVDQRRPTSQAVYVREMAETAGNVAKVEFTVAELVAMSNGIGLISTTVNLRTPSMVSALGKIAAALEAAGARVFAGDVTLNSIAIRARMEAEA